MKLALFLTLLFTLSAFADGIAQRISLTANNDPLEEVMMKIQKQQGYAFFFRGSNIADTPIKAEVKAASLEKTMEAILSGQGLDWSVTNGTIIIRRKAAIPKIVPKAADRAESTQERVITGKVSDEAGNPLEGVTVTTGQTGRGTTTGANGEYRIGISPGTDELSFVAVGYHRSDESIADRRIINVVLKVAVSELDQVVVIGYGSKKKITLTGAVGTVDSKKLENRPVASAVEALQGQVAGLNVVRTGAQPGNQSISFRVRGTSTFTSNPVLTLIDGIPSSLDRINPNDIESISVLKDGASAAIYGSRATGGVILVTTKSGKSGEPKVSLNSSLGFQSPTRFPEKVSALDHALLSNEARANDGAGPKYSDEEIQRFASADWKDYVWEDYMFKNGILNNQNVSISGGSDKHDYYVSVGYLKQDGVVINTGYERLNFQLNQNFHISDKLKLGVRAGYIPSTRTAPAGGNLSNMLSFVAAQPNTDQIRTADGKWLANSTNTGGGNPIALASEDGGQQLLKSNRMQGNFTIDYEILPKLKLSGIYGIVRNQSRQRDYRKIITLYQQENHDLIASQSEDNFLDVNYATDILQNINFLANYENTINDHHFSVMGGTVAEWYEDVNEGISTRDFLTDDIYTISAGTGDPTLWGIEGNASDWALASVISRATYSYQDKYFLEGSFRYDGSSRFANGRKWGFFPAASAGWIVSEENFLKGNNTLTFLKLRGSWGQVGNQNVGFYPFASTLAQSVYYFNGVPQRGVTTSGASNPLLTWETKETVNVGVDGNLFGNIVQFSFDLFKEQTSDILLQLPLPTTFGQAEPVQNVGIVDNKGWELELGHRNTLGQFSYGLSFQVSDATNKVVDMGEISPRISGNTITEEGRPIDEWFGWRSIGFFQSADEVTNASFQNPLTSPGDIRYEENGGDPTTITSDDRVRLGRSDPRFPYGVRLTMNYKGLDFVAFGQGVMSHLVWSNGWTANNFDRENSTLRTYHLNRWTPETPNAHFPKTRMGSGSSRSGINDSFSSFWLEDASYFRLKHIEIGYSLPPSILNKIKMDRVRLYISGENLITLTDFLGYDPETPTGTGSRLVETRYPLAKVFNFGLNLNF